MPEPDTLPPAEVLLFDASNNKTPKLGALAAVANHSRWLAMHEDLTAVDAHNDANYTNGNSRVLRREATRLVSV